MSIYSRKEFFDALQKQTGNDTSEETINFIENMTDTYNDLESRATGDGTNWEQKYKDLDESWKEKYRHRFFTGKSVMPEEDKAIENEDNQDPEKITINDLFEIKK